MGEQRCDRCQTDPPRKAPRRARSRDVDRAGRRGLRPGMGQEPRLRGSLHLGRRKTGGGATRLRPSYRRLQNIVTAIVADLNARGGVLGRRFVPVFRDHNPVDIQAQQAESQADCAYFSKDRPVVAYLDASLGQVSGIAACMQHAGIPFLDLNSAIYDDRDFRSLGPHLWPVRAPSVTRLVQHWSERLQAQRYFSGWDTLNGRPGAAPTRVRLYLEDNPLGHRIAVILTRALPAYARQVTTYFYAPTIGQNVRKRRPRFGSAKVTHLLTLPSAAGAFGLFALAAENQHYRPRYGVTSYDWLSTPSRTCRQRARWLAGRRVAPCLGMSTRAVSPLIYVACPGAEPRSRGPASEVRRRTPPPLAMPSTCWPTHSTPLRDSPPTR